jgi:hypothetical protein
MRSMSVRISLMSTVGKGFLNEVNPVMCRLERSSRVFPESTTQHL